MNLGSKEHKTQWVNELIKTYHENIWNDELYRSRMETLAGQQRKAIAAINLAIDSKEFKTRNEGEKAKFVQEREHTLPESLPLNVGVCPLVRKPPGPRRY